MFQNDENAHIYKNIFDVLIGITESQISNTYSKKMESTKRCLSHQEEEQNRKVKKAEDKCDDGVVIQAFQLFDRNGDGFINFDEMKSAMKVDKYISLSKLFIFHEFQELHLETNPDRVKALFEALDTNGDGKIDAREFLKLIEENP